MHPSRICFESLIVVFFVFFVRSIDVLEVGWSKIKMYYEHRDENASDTDRIYCLFPNIFRHFANCGTRKQMFEFLSTAHQWVEDILVGENGGIETRFIQGDEDVNYDQQETPKWLEDFIANPDVQSLLVQRKREWMKVFLVDEDGASDSFDVHDDMEFGYLVTLANDRDVALETIRFKHNNKMIFASSSRKKKLFQLDICDGDEVYVEAIALEDDSPSKVTNNSNKRSKGGKKKSPRKGARKKRAKAEPSRPREFTIEDYKRMHCKAMEPVFDEARDRFKKIRNRIDALTLVRTPRKVRTPTNAAAVEQSSWVKLPESRAGAKPGKKAYPILVGEENNLYNPSLAKKRLPDRMVLDLHGYTIKVALEKLDKNFPIWLDAAMRGDYPFVVSVDIICGSGNQILSEVVAQWIRRNKNVANRPKGFL